LRELFWCARSSGRGWSYTAPLVAPFLTVILSLFASVLAVIAPFFTPILPVFAPVFAAFHPRGLSRSFARCQHYDRDGDAYQRKRSSTRNQLFTHVYLPNNVSYPQLQQWCGPLFLVLRLYLLLLLFLCLLVRAVATVGAASGGTDPAVTGMVTSDAANNGTFNAALSVSGGCPDKQECAYC
jgi:hypothetical protein